MTLATTRLTGFFASLLFTLPVAAQTFGPNTGAALSSVAINRPNLVGTWSGQGTGPNGTMQQADSFGQDNTFMSVVRLPNGFLARFWGSYRTTPVGSSQLRIESRLQGWLPRELCQQVAGGPPQCQPFQVPTTDISLITFSSPDQRQSMSESTPGPLLTSFRDDRASLLNAQAPQRWINIVQSAPSQPATVSPRTYPSSAPTPYRNGCPSDDGQMALCKYSGTLVRSGGCLRCVG